MFMYVFITWIVANVLHPIVASIYISFYAGEMNVGAGVAGTFFLISPLDLSRILHHHRQHQKQSDASQQQCIILQLQNGKYITIQQDQHK